MRCSPAVVTCSSDAAFTFQIEWESTLHQGWLNCLLHLHWSVGQKLYQLLPQLGNPKSLQWWQILHSLLKLNGRLQTLYQGWLNCLLHQHWSVGQKFYQPEATIRVCDCDKYCIHFSYWMGEYTLHPGWLKCLLQQCCFHTRAPECWTKVISTRGNHKCLQRWQILLSLLKLNGSLLHHRWQSLASILKWWPLESSLSPI